jgi:hypothetical protein
MTIKTRKFLLIIGRMYFLRGHCYGIGIMWKPVKNPSRFAPSFEHELVVHNHGAMFR